MALYRRYRPATFADVVGQEHVTEPLCRALDSSRINHAYLFSGPRGCGKTSSARILARSLNCAQGPTSTPCGVCSSCVALAPGGPGNLDVIELDAASHGGVDDTRDLRDKAGYSPAESRYRVFIIDEAHMVTNAGFNALLKIVEEPPEHLIFIFATTEPEKVLPTIRSRTHHYPFRLLPPQVMRGLLEGICEKEGVRVEPPVFPLVIRAGGGSPRDSLSVLDQLLAGAGSGTGDGVTYERALALLGVTDVALIDDSVDALAAGDGASLFGAVERLVDAGHDPRRFAVDLLDRFRDLILLQAVPDAAARGLVEAPGDQIDRMQSQVDRIGPATLTRFAETVHAALGEMRGTTSPRLLLEVMCARMLLPAATDAESAVLQRLERVEAQLAGTAPASGVSRIPVPDLAGPTEQPPADTKFVRPSQRVEARPPAEAAEPSEVRPTTPEPSEFSEPSASKISAPDLPEPQPVTTEPAAPEAAAPEPVAPELQDEVDDRMREPETAPEPDDVADPRRDPIADDPAPVPEATADPAPQPEPGPVGGSSSAGRLDVAAVRTAWSEVRTRVRERDKVIEVMLSGATVRTLAADGDATTLVLSHDAAPLVGRLASPRGTGVIEAALQDVFGSQWTVRVEHLPNDASTVATVADPPRSDRSRKTNAPTQSYTRRSRASQTDAAPAPEETSVPEEPSPAPVADDELTDAERDEMVADAVDTDPDPRQDLEQVAIALLSSELGARRMDEGR